MSVITIILLITGYCGYFTAAWKIYLNKNHKLYSKAGFCRDIKNLNLLHIIGIFLLGLPLFFLNKQTAIFLSVDLSISPQKILVLSGLVILTVFIARKTAVTTISKFYVPNTSHFEKSIEIYLPVRILFLLIYESFFRGVLLAVCIYYSGIEWAVLINVFLYTLIHAFAEKEEIAFCPLFGTILLPAHAMVPFCAACFTASYDTFGFVRRIYFKKN